MIPDSMCPFIRPAMMASSAVPPAQPVTVLPIIAVVVANVGVVPLKTMDGIDPILQFLIFDIIVDFITSVLMLADLNWSRAIALAALTLNVASDPVSNK